MDEDLKRLLVIFLTSHRENSVAIMRLLVRQQDDMDLNRFELDSVIDVVGVLGELDLAIERAVRELKKELDNG